MSEKNDNGDRGRRRKKRANGQGSVYQRKDGMWVGSAYVLTTNGTRKRVMVYAKTSKDASTKLTRKISDSDQGIPVPAETWTVGQYLSYWLENVAKLRRQKTYEGYESNARLYLIPGLGRKKLHRLTAQQVRVFLTELKHRCRCCAEGIDAARAEPRCCAVGRCCGLRLSVRSIQLIHSILRNALQHAVREELIMRNVARLVRVETPNYRVNRGVTVDQARVLLGTAKSDRLYALYVLALYLGMRRGELLGLRWSDVDLDAGTLEIAQTLQRVGGKLVFVPPKTRRSARTVPLPRVCVDALREHRDRLARERAAADKWHASGLVFVTSTGTPIEPDNLRRSWHPVRERAGLDGVRFHDLRHSCVSLLLALAVPPNVVAEIVGHAGIEVTMTIYAHVSLEQMREALQRLDDHVG